MKRTFLKILFLVFIFVTVFAFVSCGKGDTPDPKKEPQKPSEIELPIVE